MTKPVLDRVILGINDSHDASACLVRGGRILCAVSEECLQRVKSAGGFTAHADAGCLQAAGLPRGRGRAGGPGRRGRPATLRRAGAVGSHGGCRLGQRAAGTCERQGRLQADQGVAGLEVRR